MLWWTTTCFPRHSILYHPRSHPGHPRKVHQATPRSSAQLPAAGPALQSRQLAEFPLGALDEFPGSDHALGLRASIRKLFCQFSGMDR